MDFNTKKVPINYKLKNKIRNICRCEYKYFLNKCNVVGVGCGYKVTGGFRTLNLCIQVFVLKKISKSRLSFKDIIPKCFKGIKTDIVETGEFIGCSLTNRIRPVLGGYSISPVGNPQYASTAGCLVTNGVLNFVLGTNHTLTNGNILPIGTPIIQPAGEYGGFHPNDTIATLYKFVPLRPIQGTHEPINLTDCAIGVLEDKNILSPEIAFIGKLKGVKSPILNQSVKKVGSTTELTHGTIIGLDGTATITLPSGRRYLFKNIIGTTFMSEAGDSGAILINEYNYAIGMLIAKSNNFNIYCSIKTILDQLDVRLIT